MPNGGDWHLYKSSFCPRCHSRRVHKRKGFHLIAKWKCNKCNKKFYSPTIIKYHADERFGGSNPSYRRLKKSLGRSPKIRY